MDANKVRDFWRMVEDAAGTLCAVLDTSSSDHGLQRGIRHIGRLVQKLRSAAADIDPLLTVEVDQIPTGDATVLRIAVSCNHDPEGIEAVQEVVAAAPPMSPCIQACAFVQPIPKEMAHGLGTIEIHGREVRLHQVRFLTEPSTIAPGTFDVVCFVPTSALTEMDPQDVPGALVANVVLSMGIGELRSMTRVRSIGIAMTDRPPPDSVNAWDVNEIMDSAPVH